KTIIGLAFPMWIKLYTVGPHTYILTFPSSNGTNFSFCLVIVLYNFIRLLPPFVLYSVYTISFKKTGHSGRIFLRNRSAFFSLVPSVSSARQPKHCTVRSSIP